MSDKSIKVWIVQEYGYEYDKPIKVWNNKKRAYQHAKRLEETKDTRQVGIGFCGYEVVEVPMILETN